MNKKVLVGFGLFVFALNCVGSSSDSDSEIIIEAESGILKAPMIVLEDDQASGNKAVYVPENVNNSDKFGSQSGSSTIEFVVPETATYEVWGKVFTPGKPGEREDSFFITLDDQIYEWRIFDWADNWVWRKLQSQSQTEVVRVKLEKGQHELVIGHRVSGTYLDQIKLVPLSDEKGGIWDVNPDDYKASNTYVYRDLTQHFDMPELRVPLFPDQDFPITEFGAVEGGVTVNTSSIQSAIDACADAGGGRVVIPAGEWLTGAIKLKSYVNLHLEDGAVLKFAQDFEEYLPVVFTRWEGIECYNYCPPIYGRDLENIAITGNGLIDGQGEFWWDWKTRQKKTVKRLYQMVVDAVAPNQRVLGTEEDAMRPNFIQFINCKNILIENVTFKNGPMWTVHPVYCDGMIVRGMKVKTVGPNNDGINPDSSRNILIEDCYFSTGDDCVVLKSGLNEDGWRIGKPTENIVIRRVFAHEGHGGVVVGSEMSGGVHNVHAYDCVFDGTDRGFRMKSMRGRGGKVSDIWIEDIKMRNIGGQAIRLNMFYKSSTVVPITEIPAQFKNIYIRNIECDGASRAVEIYGLPELAIDNIVMENIRIRSNQGIWIVDGQNICMKDFDLATNNGVPVYLENVSHSSIDDMRLKAEYAPWIQIKGKSSSDLTFERVRGKTAPIKMVESEAGESSYTLK